MHKDKRVNSWVSEVNGWVKNRIDYTQRPDSWGKYVAEIDEIRTSVNELVVQTIKLIDDIYRKGRYTQGRWKQIERGITVFKRHTFAENHLPVSAVDPYCLYSEGKDDIPAAEYFPMRQLLSVEKYKRFRKYFNELYSSLDNFYNQFAEVLLVRIKKQSISSIKNPRIAMFNLYSAAKALHTFCYEYDFLFSEYSSLSTSFEHAEEENLLTLLNVWRHILDNPPKGQAIAYESKLRYRKGKTFFRDSLAKIPGTIGAPVFLASHHAYITKDYSIDENNPIEKEYANLVYKLRDVFQCAVLPSSDRWYCETQPIELAYIPIISGSYLSTALSIPFYKLFDSDISVLEKTMLPCEIEPEVKEKFFTKADVLTWISAMEKIQEIKRSLKRFEQVIQIEPSENCIHTAEVFTEKTEKQVQTLWSGFSACENIVKCLAETTDQQISEMVNVIKAALDCYDDIIICIKCKDNDKLKTIIQTINVLSSVMLLLQPTVSSIQIH